MLTGPALGAAIEAARKLKGVTKKAVAEKFGVTPPSIQDWVNRGTIDKEKLPALWAYFSDVAGPAHWGLDQWPSSSPAFALRPAWPFAHIDEQAIAKLAPEQISTLEGALVLTAGTLQLPIVRSPAAASSKRRANGK